MANPPSSVPGNPLTLDQSIANQQSNLPPAPDAQFASTVPGTQLSFAQSQANHSNDSNLTLDQSIANHTMDGVGPPDLSNFPLSDFANNAVNPPTVPGGPTPASIQQNAGVLGSSNTVPSVSPNSGSTSILSARGAFYLVALSPTASAGIYAVEELTQPPNAPPSFSAQGVANSPLLANTNTTSQTNNSATSQAAYNNQVATFNQSQTTSPILITGVEINQADITSQVPCLNNFKVFYTFGQNFGNVMVSGEILLGPMGNISKDGYMRLVNFFWQNRVSVKKAPIKVSIAQNGYFVYLTGMKIGAVDANYHVMPFLLYGTLLDISRDDASQINPNSTVLTSGNINNPSLLAALNTTSTPTAISQNNNPPDNAVANTGAGNLTQQGDVTPPAAPISQAGAPGNSTAAIMQKQLSGQPLTSVEQMSLDTTLNSSSGISNPSSMINTVNSASSTVPASVPGTTFGPLVYNPNVGANGIQRIDLSQGGTINGQSITSVNGQAVPAGANAPFFFTSTPSTLTAQPVKTTATATNLNNAVTNNATGSIPSTPGIGYPATVNP